MSQVYKINEVGGVAISKLEESLEVSSAGQEGWSIQTYSGGSVDYTMLIAEEGAEVFPLHSDVNEWFGYVVEGSGELHLGDADHIKEKVEYKAGDIIIFKPNTYHGWQGATKSKLMFVKSSHK